MKSHRTPDMLTRITFMVTYADKDAIMDMAQEIDLTASQYIRHCVRDDIKKRRSSSRKQAQRVRRRNQDAHVADKQESSSE